MQAYSIMLQQIIGALIGCLVLNRMVMDHQILALNIAHLFGVRNWRVWFITTLSLPSISLHIILKFMGWSQDGLSEMPHYFWFCCEGMLMCIFYRKCNLAGSKTMFCSCFVWTCNWGWFYTSPSFRQDIWIIYCKFPSFPSTLITLDLLSVKLVICGRSKFCRVTKTLSNLMGTTIHHVLNFTLTQSLYFSIMC
jgi:hypothetical protein